MLNLVELSVKIVMEHGEYVDKSPDEVVADIKKVYSDLKALDSGEVDNVKIENATPEPSGILKKVRTMIGKNEITCLLCGTKGKVLKQHLTKQHHITPVEYKEQFGIPLNTPLVAREYHERRRKYALDNGLGKVHYSKHAR